MDEIEMVNDDISIDMLGFIYGEISFKKAEISQRNLEKKIEELKFDYTPKNEKEKIDSVLMQVNDLLE